MDVRLNISGTSPLVMHNIRLADEREPIVKAIKELTSKRSKTEDDYFEIERLEWIGGLYFDDEAGYYLPTWGVIRTLENAAKATRQGSQLIRAVAATERFTPLQFPHRGLSVESLWKLEQYRWRTMVGVNNAKVARTRPIFPEWNIKVDLFLEPSLMDFGSLEQIARRAGMIEGMFDARKLGYGRFEAKVEELSKA